MSTPAAKSRINNIMNLILSNEVQEEIDSRSLVSRVEQQNLELNYFMPMEEDYNEDQEVIFSFMPSPSLLHDYVPDCNIPQDDSAVTKNKSIVEYTDSDSNDSYTLLNLDNQDKSIATAENNNTTFNTNTLNCTQNESEPLPSTSNQSCQSENNVALTPVDPFTDSEESWKPGLSADDTDHETPQEIEEETSIGKRGYRKKKPLPKRLLKKKNRQAAVGKSMKPNPCLNKKCGNSCADKFNEDERMVIFENYWGLGCIKRQKDFLLGCVYPKPIGRKRAMSNTRQISYDYYLNFRGEHVKVCQQFLLKTLDISQMTLRYTVENANKVLNISKEDGRIPQIHNKSDPEKVAYLKSFIEMLPAVPSHYCRNKSTKLYLPQDYENVSNLYKMYVAHLKANKLNSEILSKRVFRHIFKTDFNIGFHLPKKDKCTICEKYKNLPPESRDVFEQSAEYKKHNLDNIKCKELFLEDQKRSKAFNSASLCVSFDLEKVLNTPHGKSVTLYYTRKYAFYNESIYESGTRAGYCYVWGECQGRRGCNEVVTVLFKYLSELDSKGNHIVINLYADSCAGQNRNRVMIAMLIYFLKTSTTITTIKITYLLPGHTMMPVDSIHSTIESFVRNKTVWAPSEWPTMITNARSNPRGYVVNVLNHADFLDWKTFSQALLPAKFKISFNSLRMVHLQKDNPVVTLQYGFFEDDRKQEINLNLIIRSRANTASVTNGPAQLYNDGLKISAAKYKDLVDLCNKNIIPSRYHAEYLNMDHDGAIPDVLAETDEEDDN